MGIELFYPRLPLPGAKPSPDYDFSELDFLVTEQAGSTATAAPSDESNKAAASSAEPARSKRASATQSARAQLGKQSPTSEVPAPLAKAADEAQQLSVAKPGSASDAIQGAESAEAALQFRLEYRKVNNKLAVLIETPLYARQDAQRECAQLLENILLALDVPLAEQVKSVEQFNWPLLKELPVEETTAHHARQALLGFIAMRRQRDEFSNLLIFSSQSGQVREVLPEAEQGHAQPIAQESVQEGAQKGLKDSAQVPRTDYELPRLSCWITRVSSLQEMLTLPAIKREVWQQLQPLRQRLRLREHLR
jgi:hypothetical protein